MSARISGVKNFESQGMSFVRGFPFSQVQSASEKGSIFFGPAGSPSAGAAAELVRAPVEGAPASAAALGFADDEDSVTVGAPAFGAVAGEAATVSEARDFFSSDSSSSIRFRIDSSS